MSAPRLDRRLLLHLEGNQRIWRRKFACTELSRVCVLCHVSHLDSVAAASAQSDLRYDQSLTVYTVDKAEQEQKCFNLQMYKEHCHIYTHTSIHL